MGSLVPEHLLAGSCLLPAQPGLHPPQSPLGLSLQGPGLTTLHLELSHLPEVPLSLPGDFRARPRGQGTGDREPNFLWPSYAPVAELRGGGLEQGSQLSHK